MNKYILIDNLDYLWFYLRYLRDDYIPIVLDLRAKANLEIRKVSYIGIFDYLSLDAIKIITEQSFLCADALLKQLDKENQKNYLKIFGSLEIKLMESTIKYLFTRFTMAALRLLRGMEGIIKNHKIDELAYLHDGNPVIKCGTKKERGFLFPDNITWEILEKWQHKSKPKLTFLEGYRHHLPSQTKKKRLKMRCLNLLRELRIMLHPLKKAILQSDKEEQIYSVKKKSILLIGPLYDFALVLSDLSPQFNIVRWDSDGEYLPSKIRNVSAPSRECLQDLSFKAEAFSDTIFFDNLNYKELAVDLIKRFYEKKLPDILRYWRQAKLIYERYKIDIVLWNNSPHRYPDGMVKEFFRLKNVPICGMQHGGLNGSNLIGRTFFDNELNNCDYYFSYGFRREDVELEGQNFTCQQIIPVGSPKIKDIIAEPKNYPAAKKKVDIIFPVAMSREEFFFDSEVNKPWLIELQKKIIDILAGANNKKILLKFPLGQYTKSALSIYIEDKYPGNFIIIDHISFSDCLKQYEADTILIEEQSTPLSEALTTKSNLLVYNNPNWCGLTNQAYQLLSKRAVICNAEDLFLKSIKDCLADRLEEKDTEHKEFVEKYCNYKGSPEKNIQQAIINLLASEQQGTEIRDFTYAS